MSAETQLFYNSAVRNIPHAEPRRAAYRYDLIEQVDKFNGSKNFVKKGVHYNFRVGIEIAKYADPEAEMQFYLALYGQTIQFKPDNFMDWILDESGENVNFYVVAVIPLKIEGQQKYDKVVLLIESISYSRPGGIIWRYEDYGEVDDGDPIDFRDEDGDFNIIWDID